jgi:hypothetical protein
VLRDLDYNNPLNNNGGCLGQVLWLAVAVAVCFLMGGCKTKYVTVPEYHEVIVNKHDTLVTRDSIFQKDSVYMWMQGDTIWKEKYSVLYRDRWRDKIVYRDSIKTDSVRVAYPVVTNKVGWKDKIAYIGIGLIISFFIWIFCKIRLS